MTGYVSKDQYKNACSVNLAEWLLRHHPTAVKLEYGSVLLRADKHVSVKRGFHGYKDFKTGETGNAVDYLMRFLGYGYKEAVIALTDGECIDATPKMPLKILVPKSIDIILPKPAEGRYRQLFAFLMGRKIPADVIQQLVDDGILYQSDIGSNCVFISPQGDYCELRGTNTYADRRCKLADECQDYREGKHRWCTRMSECSRFKKKAFHGCRKTRPDRFWYFQVYKDKTAEVVYVCEAAIDAISLYVLHRMRGKERPAVYVSIGGVANQKTIDRLKICGKLVLAVDNDEAGEACRGRNPDIPAIIPILKDWNEDLQAYVEDVRV